MVVLREGVQALESSLVLTCGEDLRANGEGKGTAVRGEYIEGEGWRGVGETLNASCERARLVGGDFCRAESER